MLARARAHPGRPRSAGADDSILRATAGLLVEVGYRAMSMEAISSRAGISKATLYRRFKDKQEVVVATITAASGPPPTDQTPLPDSTRDALLLLAGNAAVATSDPSWLPILGAVFSESQTSGGLASVMRSQIFDPVSAIVARVVRRAIERGEIRADVSAETVNDIIHGAIVVRSMLGEELSEAWVESLVDTIWAAFAVGSTAGSAGPVERRS
jgi:AcrR family transcriptional regulator